MMSERTNITFLALVFAAVAVVVVSTVVLVGMEAATEMAQSINQTAIQESANETTTPSPYYKFPPIGAVLLIIGVVVFAAYLNPDRSGTDPSDNTNQDPIALLKNEYVEGDIQTTVKLESELEDVLDDSIDDATVAEINDLLDDGDDSE